MMADKNKIGMITTEELEEGEIQSDSDDLETISSDDGKRKRIVTDLNMTNSIRSTLTSSYQKESIIVNVQSSPNRRRKTRSIRYKYKDVRRRFPWSPERKSKSSSYFSRNAYKHHRTSSPSSRDVSSDNNSDNEKKIWDVDFDAARKLLLKKIDGKKLHEQQDKSSEIPSSINIPKEDTAPPSINSNTSLVNNINNNTDNDNKESEKPDSDDDGIEQLRLEALESKQNKKGPSVVTIETNSVQNDTPVTNENNNDSEDNVSEHYLRAEALKTALLKKLNRNNCKITVKTNPNTQQKLSLQKLKLMMEYEKRKQKSQKDSQLVITKPTESVDTVLVCSKTVSVTPKIVPQKDTLLVSSKTVSASSKTVEDKDKLLVSSKTVSPTLKTVEPKDKLLVSSKEVSTSPKNGAQKDELLVSSKTISTTPKTAQKDTLLLTSKMVSPKPKTTVQKDTLLLTSKMVSPKPKTTVQKDTLLLTSKMVSPKPKTTAQKDKLLVNFKTISTTPQAHANVIPKPNDRLLISVHNNKNNINNNIIKKINKGGIAINNIINNKVVSNTRICVKNLGGGAGLETGPVLAKKAPTFNLNERFIIRLDESSSDEENDRMTDAPPTQPAPPAGASNPLINSVDTFLATLRKESDKRLLSVETPEAVHKHLPPSQRLEYIRLKRKLAQKEAILKKIRTNNNKNVNNKKAPNAISMDNLPSKATVISPGTKQTECTENELENLLKELDGHLHKSKEKDRRISVKIERYNKEIRQLMRSKLQEEKNIVRLFKERNEISVKLQCRRLHANKITHPTISDTGSVPAVAQQLAAPPVVDQSAAPPVAQQPAAQPVPQEPAVPSAAQQLDVSLQYFSFLNPPQSTIRLDPNKEMCPHDLMGVCRDQECPYQHTRPPNKT